jgi:hypothetical protein
VFLFRGHLGAVGGRALCDVHLVPSKVGSRSFHDQALNTFASCSETSERRKEFLKSPTNSCQCFCVMDAPEIYQASGPVVVSEFLTAI